MQIEVTEGCTAFSYTVNDKEWIINEVIGEYKHAWDEDNQLSEIIDIIDKNKIVQSKYESNG